MTKARLDGLYLLLLGSVIFLLLGLAMENAAPAKQADFRGLYYSGRCLLQHCDPYNADEVLRIYQAEGGDSPSDTEQVRQIATQTVYLPTAFSYVVPIALLPWGPAHVLWIALTTGSLILASFLIWDLGASYAPVLSGGLIGFLLANSEVLIITGNAAGLVVSLCAVAVWCFLRQRFVPTGIVCLAISLAIKPHDTGLVWLCLLLAGGVYCKRALQTLLVTVALSLPAVLWVWHVSPHWMQELHSNILAYSVHGGTNDPGPASRGAHGLDMVINLQTTISFFWDDPRIYNPAAWLVCAPLFVIWGFFMLRNRLSSKNVWLALAAIAALSMLPVYHRQLDAKLLLLTVPACAMLWAEGGMIGRLALLLNTLGFVLTGDLPWAILLGLISKLHLPDTAWSRDLVIAVQVFPVPLILLTIGIFYLWIFVKRATADSASGSAKVLSPWSPSALETGQDNSSAASL